MPIILIDLSHIILDKMIILKIINLLPPNFNIILDVQSNVHEYNQIVDHLKERLLCHESLLLYHGGGDIEAKNACFTHIYASLIQPLNKKEQQ